MKVMDLVQAFSKHFRKLAFQSRSRDMHIEIIMQSLQRF